VQARRVDTEDAFRRAIDEFRPQLILADFRMPRFDGLSALAIARERCPDVPFIFFSGTIGEANAVRALQAGATDYVLKDNIARLAPAVRRALHEAEQRRAEKLELAEARLRFDATFAQAAFGMAHTDLGGRFLLVNPKFCDVSGYSREELLGRTLRELVHPDDLAQAVEYDAGVTQRTLSPHEVERRFVRKGGEVFWASITTSLVRDAAHWPSYFVHALQDVSERKRMEEALRRAEQDYRVIFDNAVTGIFAVNVAGRVVSANAALVRILGYDSRDDLMSGISSVARDVYVEPGARRRFRETLLGRGVVERFETQWRRKDGTLIWVSMSGRLVDKETGGAFSHIGMVEDITERKRAELVRALEHAVTRCLAESEDTGQALRAVLRTVCESEGWQCGRYLAVDEDAGLLRFAEAWGSGDADAEEFIARSRPLSLRKGEGLSGIVWQSGEPLWVNDVQKDGRARGVTRPASLQGGALVFPVRSGGRTIGVMNFSSRHPRAPDEPLRRASGIIASQVGQFLERKRAEAALQRFRMALDSSADMILIVDPATLRFVDVNDTMCRLLGYSRDELLAMGPADILPVTPEQLSATYAELIANPSGTRGLDSYYVCKDGSHLPFESTRRAVHAADRWLIVVVARDVRERLAAEKALREREAGLRRAQVMARLAHVVTGPDGSFESWSSTLPELIGAAPDAVPRSTREWLELVHPEDAPGLRETLIQAAREGRRKKFRYRLRHREGEWIHLRTTVEPLRGEDAGPRWFTTMQDVTEQREAEQKIEFLAYYDPITGLANRTLFEERLEEHLKAAAPAKARVALVIVDVERFKTINDTFGRDAGDELLRQIAWRISRLHGDSTRLARLGADQLGIVSLQVASEEEFARLTETRFREVFGEPFTVGSSELRVAAKAGIALYPADGTTPETLFRNAEAALKKAKAAGERYLFYRQDMTARIAENLALENKLRRGLENEEFVLHYQPKVDSETGAIVGLEALIRWQSPELGLVPPVQFIPLLEQTGLILQVGNWALRRAALDHRAWSERGLKAPRIAVNVSPIQMRQRNFVAVVEQAIREGLAPTGIDLEITESLVMEDVQANIAKLKALRALGMSIAIDDFGTGYSSLAYLAQLPVQTLKIDRSFVKGMHTDPNAMSLISTIIQLAHSLRLKVVAEGVETDDQAKFLRLLRCDELQGYLFSKPLPADALALRLG
jgi:diguanylate cyclase (GGDEF)-like protein/PAS domain S-box-containing protein